MSALASVPAGTVESTMFSRRINSASQRGPSELLGNVGPVQRDVLSADVRQRRRDVVRLQRETFDQSKRQAVVKSLLEDRLTLTHLGVHLDAEKAHIKPKPKPSRKDFARCLLDEVLSADAAVKTLDALQSLPAHIKDESPYLQEIEHRSRIQAGTINASKLFVEWEGMIGSSDKQWFDSLNDDDRKALFAQFARSRRNKARPAEVRETIAPQTAMDDLVPPSDPLPTLVYGKPDKMLLHAGEKRHYHQLLLQRSTRDEGTTTQRSFARRTTYQTDATAEARAEAQRHSQAVFERVVRDNVEHRQNLMKRTALRHSALVACLNFKRNLSHEQHERLYLH